jgi:hypothetical protein
MLREMKFRIWDCVEGRFLEAKDSPFINLNGVPMVFQPNVGFCGGERFVLSQWTGILDKKGTEIFEGDIVKLDFDNRPLLAGDPTVVKWVNGGCMYWPFNLSSRSEAIEVIGHHFEKWSPIGGG